MVCVWVGGGPCAGRDGGGGGGGEARGAAGGGGGMVHARYTPVVAGVLTVLTSSQGLLTTASKRDGKYEYNFGVVVLLAETVKFCVACLLLRKARREVRGDPDRSG